ncbi:hypothetical protein ACFYO2_19535 [Streptomyces sp. NPDC006602]|uniref:hypothetical protein n=1 Tax=Streptomyces sp. NPDC006602 TaxID=3364751 RepID=UPI003697F7C7
MTRVMNFGLLTGREDRRGLAGGRVVTMGPYVYTPSSALSAPGANGTLSKEGRPVALQVTEPLLQSFLDTVARLEADLVQRWGTLEVQGTSPLAE